MTCFTRSAAVWAAVALVGVLAGCSNSLRRNYLRDKVAHHVYRKTLPEIWPAVKAELEEQGYSWREMPGRFVLETEWLDSGGGTLGPVSSSKYLVEGIVLPNGGCGLRIMRGDRISQSTGVQYVDGPADVGNVIRGQEMAGNVGKGSAGSLPTEQRFFRDLELELKILQRVDPETVRQWERESESSHP